MKKHFNIPSLMLPVTALVIIGSLLLWLESDFLWKLQETNLFLSSWIFFLEQMVEPGGFLSWVGTWFTQFFFHPWLGVLVLCAWWLLLMWLIQRTFRVSHRWLPVTIIPVLFLLVTIVDMGYWIYILKLRGHVFLGTIGTTAVVALQWLFRVIAQSSFVTHHAAFKTPLLCLFIALTCAVGYPLLGIYGLGATVLMAVWIWRLEPHRSSALAVSLAGFLSACLLPLFFYRFVYYQTNLANIYVAKLPLFVVTEEYTLYYLPHVLLLAFFLVMTLIPHSPYGPSPVREGRKVTSVGRGSPLPNRGGAGGGAVRSVWSVRPVWAPLLLLAAIFYTCLFWYRDENFHHELAMQRCIDHLNWEGVLEEAAQQKDEPTRAIVMMRNLALAHLGRQADEMYHFKNGCKQCDAPFDIRAINTVGSLIYYHYGMPNYSYRLCMERGVEFGWRAEQLKYMARCSIINGEPQLAHKYLGLLQQTMFHDSWANDMYDVTSHPENKSQMPEMDFITHMMHYDNELTTDHNLVEDFLMKRLLSSNYSRDPVFLEQQLLASMAAKNTQLFWPRLYKYSHFFPDRPWPVHVQEAVYLFGIIEGRPNMEQCPVSPAVKENFKRWQMIAPRYEGQSAEQVSEALYPLFGNTYYFDYYLVNFPSQN